MRPPRLFRTAIVRLAALYGALFGVSVIVLGVVVFLTADAALKSQMDRHLNAEAQALALDFAAGGRDRLAGAVRARAAIRGAGALDYGLTGPDGRLLAGDLRLPPGAEGRLTLPARPAGGEEQGEQDNAALRVLALRLADGSVLAVGDDLGRIDDVQEAILRAFAWALAATLALGAGGGVALGAGFLRRIDAITRTAEAIIAGDLRRRITLRGTGDDLDRLAGTLNRMLDRIGALMDSLRQVSADIAHDLRTPLARLRQRLETARDDAAIEAAVAEVDAILETFSALLRIAEIEAGARRAAFRPVDLAEIAAPVTEAFAPAAEDAGRRLVLAAPGGQAMVQGDRGLLTQLLANLVENALHHTPPGTKITIGVDPRGPLLSVADDGPGVPAAERENVLRRFYRLERSRTSAGSGLGLSLVAAIADLHGARVTLGDNAPGLVVRVAFGSGTHGQGNTVPG